jgi:hypothetical protein
MSLGSASNFFLGAASAAGGGGYEITRSLRFNSADNAYLNRTFLTGNRTKWTWSGWVKRTALGSGRYHIFGNVTNGSTIYGSFEFNNDTLVYYDASIGSSNIVFQTTRVFRDISAWYHIVIALDTSQSTDATRIKVWVNGVQETVFTSRSVSADGKAYLNDAGQHNIGSWDPASSGLDLDAYLAEVHFIDGLALAASDFGEYDDNNVWQPKAYEGNYSGPGSGTIYSDDLTSSTGAFKTSSPATNAFDGSDTSGNRAQVEPSNADNYIEFEPSTPISFTNGVYVKCYAANGYGITNYYSVDLTGGGLGSETSFTGGGSGFNDVAWIQVATGSGTLYKVRIRLIRPGDASSAGITAIGINGTASGNWLVDGTPDGVNGFRLDFSDNSSNAALGTDSSGNDNDWTVNNIEAVSAYGIERACSIYGPSYETFTFPITYTTTVTFEAFVRITNNVSYNYLAYNSSNNWNLGISGGNLLFGNFAGTYITFTGTGLNDGNWHFVRLTTTGSTNTSLYIDGVLNNTITSDNGVSTGTEVTNEVRSAGVGRMRVAYMRITTGGTPPTTGIPAFADMNQPAGTGGTLAFFDKLDDIAGSGTKTSDGGNVTITMSAATVATDRSGTDSLIDSPTNYTAGSGNNGGNYATLNPISAVASAGTSSNGNLDWSDGNNISNIQIPSSGKWYAEQTITGLGPDVTYGASFGVRSYDISRYARLRTAANYGQTAGLGTGSTPSYSQLIVNDVIGIAVDSDGGSITFYVNNSSVYQVTGITDMSGLFFYTAFASAGDAGSWNFGQRPFAYTPPTDYVSLCTQNLTNPTVADGGTAMNVALYTGNGASNSITGLGFSPDILWLKSRSNPTFPALANSVVGPYYFLRTNGTNTESGPGYNDDIVSFDSDGFTLGADTYYAFCNQNTYTYVGWAWDSGTTTGSNTDGTITSQVRANQSTGCSVVSYTSTDVAGATVGHGLNAVMDFAIFKNRDRGQNWLVYHKSLDITSGEAINLNQTNVVYTSAAQFNSTLATSSVFTLGTGGNASNAAGDDIIAFCFAAVEGYSAFGSYEGNGAVDGPFVYTGFRPKFVLLKNVDNGSTGYDWHMNDTERDPYNVSDSYLNANTGAAENTFGAIDFLSNGFKLRTSGGSYNQSGYTFIFACFAEHPFKTARAR